MFINKLRLQNFKRFTDLTIDLSAVQQPAPKLVLMIGANGSGKTCIFDAFEWVSRYGKDQDTSRDANRDNFNQAYYAKKPEAMAYAKVEFADGSGAERGTWATEEQLVSTTFYGRSALRQVPELTRKGLSAFVNLERDSDRPRRYIEVDQRFENDLAMLIRRIFAEVFGPDFNAEVLKTRFIVPINSALQRIFGSEPATSLKMVSLLPPAENQPAEIRFAKGNSEIKYDLLSSGEKEIINILLNLFTRREFYQNTIYFIDELDVHLNTALQYNLLKEITENWLPDNCQLWTASHSLGFIQYAREAAHAAILDFDQFDFDLPQTITPLPKESLEVYEIAVPKETLLRVFQGKQLILCENKNDEYYNLLGLPDKLFIGVQDKRQVYLNVKQNPAYFGLMDRDFITAVEIAKLRQQFPNLRVLGYYAFENYLYHPDNLREAFPDFEAEAYRAEIVRQKNEHRDYILTGLEGARRGYSVLNDENIKRDEQATQTIIEALRSDDLETFYPYFDMKTRFNRQSLSKLKLSPKRLVQTNWFQAAILSALQSS